MIGRHLTTLDKITIGIDNIERIKYLKIFVQQLQRMENVIREQISSPPPPYSPLSGYEAKSTMIQSSRYQEPVESLQQSQCPLSPCFQKRDFPPEINPSTHSSIEPIIMPIVMPQSNILLLNLKILSSEKFFLKNNIQNKNPYEFSLLLFNFLIF